MQEFHRSAGEKTFRLPNPLLDFAVAAVEAQLKAWQAYQIEGAHFVAKRMRNNLEQLRALGHCCDAQSIGTRQLAWLREIQTDYAEEWGRVAATTLTLGTAEFCGLGCLFGQRLGQDRADPKRQPGTQAKSKGLQAAA
jgi:hypothetical protein